MDKTVDSFGSEVQVGDEVAFVTSGYSVSLRKGTFIGVTPSGRTKVKTIVSRWAWRPDGNYTKESYETTTVLQNNLFIKLNPPKPAWQWLGTHETSSSRK